ncbi:condensin-2 complex subunit D3 [Senna tora]|uniref:Condensin-2 complex subunit D3 n=1 Tax=Senna tora TaxID=362788 RepID=A0A835C818_9FABA|nr:condensin-2 complex subunit D3 [Senna tora]
MLDSIVAGMGSDQANTFNATGSSVDLDDDSVYSNGWNDHNFMISFSDGDDIDSDKKIHAHFPVGGGCWRRWWYAIVVGRRIVVSVVAVAMVDGGGGSWWWCVVAVVHGGGFVVVTAGGTWCWRWVVVVVGSGGREHFNFGDFFNVKADVTCEMTRHLTVSLQTKVVDLVNSSTPNLLRLGMLIDDIKYVALVNVLVSMLVICRIILLDRENDVNKYGIELAEKLKGLFPIAFAVVEGLTQAAPNEFIFRKAMEKMKSHDEDAYKYLMGIPLHAWIVKAINETIEDARFCMVKLAGRNLYEVAPIKAKEKKTNATLVMEGIFILSKFVEEGECENFKIRGFAFFQTMAEVPVLALELSVDLILNLVMSLKDPLGVNSENEPWGIWCLEALMKRCSDVTAAIRARALSNLAQLVGFLSNDAKSEVVLKNLMESSVSDKSVGDSINNLLRRRCMDDKAAVRKAALLLVTKLTALLGGAVDEVVLKTMGMACLDPLISMRKAAIAALSEAFRTFSDETVITEWLHSVPRLISDNESSIQEECENLFVELVLDRISKVASATPSYSGSISNTNMKENNLDTEMEKLFPEGVCYLLRAIGNREVTPWVKKICTNLGKKKRLNNKIVAALQNIIRLSESFWLSHSMPIEKWVAPPGAWFLLSEVSAYLPKAVDWEFLHHHWQLLDKHEMEGKCKSPFEQGNAFEEEESIECSSVAWASDRVFLLQTISNVSVELPSEPAADLAHNLLKRIEEFNMHSTEVDAHVKALKTLCNRKAGNLTEAESLVLKWVDQVLLRASEIIEKFISEGSEKTKESSFFTPPRSGSRRGRKSLALSKSLSQTITAIYTIGSLVIVCPSADMSTVVPLLHTIITSGSSDPKLNKLLGPANSLKKTAPSLYIQGWLAMGKLCLADGKLAKSYMPIFVQELEKSESAALRNNIVVMMADFCVRYTALVDCYITKITKCLRDPCELVRRQTFILLARLLQRDYVKWRGVLFLRFLLSLVDESEKIRHLADFLFGNILKVKAPLLAYNSFVEAIFVLNDCHAHNGRNGSHSSGTESQLFSIRGTDENSKTKRMHIYVSLLKRMAPEHLLATFAKLCAEILAAASDGMLSIEDATAQSVLQVLYYTSNSEHLSYHCVICTGTRVPDIEEEGDKGVASMAAARGKAITQIVKKGLIQNTVPIFIELKRLLESKNSPLVGSLMECLRVLLKDYKNEIDEILVADKQLQKELIYDMQKYEAAKAKATVAEAAATTTMPKSSTYRSPEASNGQSKDKNKFQNSSEVASAMADAAAAAKTRSVLKEVNKGTGTPPLSSLGVPKVKSRTGGFISRISQIGASKRSSVAGIIIAAEDGDAVVQEDENEEEEERDADGRSADPVDGIGLAGGENGGDEGAAIGGEKLDGEEEEDGEKEETERAEEFGDGFGDGFALIAEKERNHYHNGYHYCQEDAVGRTTAAAAAAVPFFYHSQIFLSLSLSHSQRERKWENGNTKQ